MLLLVSGATRSVAKYKERGNLGVLLTPQNRNSVESIIKLGVPWAADNGAFGFFDEDRFAAMIERIGMQRTLLFATCPDVVASAAETLELFELWAPWMMEMCVPVALVAQDGMSEDDLPWHYMAALFVGGTTQWKLGQQAAELIAAAKKRGKWVHMGRVNTLRRIEYAGSVGADSIDGTAFSRFGDRWIPWAQPHLGVRQLSIFEQK